MARSDYWRNNPGLFGRDAKQNLQPQASWLYQNYVASIRLHPVSYVVRLSANGPETAKRCVVRALGLVSGIIVRITEDTMATKVSPTKLRFQHFDKDDQLVEHDWDDQSVGPWLVNALLTVCNWFDQTDNLNAGSKAVIDEQLTICGLSAGQELLIQPNDYFVVWQDK